ncbi:glycosyltransferase family 4 protein [Deminuibacter soli]|uniref:glycosyltransferase family 4 protein n=1 Tax=Deminuibacter soli TaxID=2291815 RepID=UPI001313DDBE|nr:glycosyltransferase family 1 protein [Deminuibacter soli]
MEETCRQFKSGAYSNHTFHFFDTSLPVYSGRNKALLLLSHLQMQFWKQVTLPFKAWRKKCDILFCNDYFTPLVTPGFKTVQVFHDAFFFEYPQHYNRIWLVMFKLLALPAARRCKYVVVPTNYARERVHHFTRIPKEKLVTIFEGPKTFPVTDTATALPAQLQGAQNCRYILHVGVMEKRKNLPALIKAYKMLLNEGYTGYKLVLVGKGSGKTHSDSAGEVAELIKILQLEQHVLVPGYLTNEELAHAYAHADMYVFPSVNEGFGIPVLEAFRFNLPVLVANNTCLPEVGGDAVLTFNPFDEKDICNKIKLVIDTPALKEQLQLKGKERLALFSWEKAAAELFEVFKMAVA